jgi:hypothetical protein
MSGHVKYKKIDDPRPESTLESDEDWQALNYLAHGVEPAINNKESDRADLRQDQALAAARSEAFCRGRMALRR